MNYTELERAFLGSILIQPNLLPQAYRIKPQFLKSEKNQKIYANMLQLEKAGKTIILGNIDSKIADKDYLYYCISYQSQYNFQDSITTILENYKARKTKALLQKTIKLEDEEIASEIDYLGNQLLQINTLTNQKSFSQPQEELTKWLEEKSKQINSPKLDLPFTTFQQEGVKINAGWLVTIAARPKMGKSTMALQIALETAKNAKKVALLSLEMNSEEIMNKSIAYLAGISPTVVANWGGDSEASQRSQKAYADQFSKGLEEFSKLDFLLFSESCTIFDIPVMIRNENMKGKLDLIVIDQLSFIQTDGQFSKSNKVQEYDFIVRKLKMLAKELQIPIILLAQLNRDLEKRGDDRPKLSDLKDSGGIEETSDMIILLHKVEEKASCYITSRHSAGGKFDLAWDTKLAKFKNL